MLTWPDVWAPQERFSNILREGEIERLLRPLPQRSGIGHHLFDRVLSWLVGRRAVFPMSTPGCACEHGKVPPRPPKRENRPGRPVGLEEVAYCGLYCGLCASRRRIPDQAARLRRMLCREGYDQGYFDVPGLGEVFQAFWEGLNRLADSPCRGCRNGGGDPACVVRTCAQERGVTVCPLCLEYPCQRLEALQHYPLLPTDASRLRYAGLEQWVAEQEARAANGFAYADVRSPEETPAWEIGSKGFIIRR